VASFVFALAAALCCGTARADDAPASPDEGRVPTWAQLETTLDAGELELGGSLGPGFGSWAGNTRFDLVWTPRPGLLNLRIGLTDWLELDGLVFPVWTIPLEGAAPRVSFGVGPAGFYALGGHFGVPVLALASSTWVMRRFAFTAELLCSCSAIATGGALPPLGLAGSGVLQARFSDLLASRFRVRATGSIDLDDASLAPVTAPNWSGAPSIRLEGPSFAVFPLSSVRLELMPTLEVQLSRGKAVAFWRAGAIFVVAWTPRIF
jgi:hypothetical protein